MEQKELKKVFEEIDSAIYKNLTEKPVPLKRSKFYKSYLEIKGRYLKNE